MAGNGTGQPGQGQDEPFFAEFEEAAGRLGFGARQPQGEASAEHTGRDRRYFAARRRGEDVLFSGKRNRQLGLQFDRVAAAAQRQFHDLAGAQGAGQHGQQTPGEKRGVVAAQRHHEPLAGRQQPQMRAAGPSDPLEPAQRALDDEPEIGSLIKELLEIEGLQVDAFVDPITALKAFTELQSQYFMIISDLSMPGMSGVEFARKVREMNKKLPMVLWSGYHQFLDEELQDLNVKMLSKPVDVQKLLTLINAELSQLSAPDISKEAPAPDSEPVRPT